MQTFDTRWETLKNELGITRNRYFESEGARLAGARAAGTGQLADEVIKHPKVQAMIAEAQKLQNEARLLGLKVPEAITEARFWSGGDAKSAVYFRHAPKNVTSAFTGAIGAAADDIGQAFKLRYKGQQ